jgi:hypothetical protein
MSYWNIFNQVIRRRKKSKIFDDLFFCLEFSLEREIETPTMSFGGRQGKTVTFLILKKESCDRFE